MHVNYEGWLGWGLAISELGASPTPAMNGTYLIRAGRVEFTIIRTTLLPTTGTCIYYKDVLHEVCSIGVRQKSVHGTMPSKFHVNDRYIEEMETDPMGPIEECGRTSAD